eukprot:scaffold218_cov67-Phaeocystis_antarctica.AAC.2
MFSVNTSNRCAASSSVAYCRACSVLNSAHSDARRAASIATTSRENLVAYRPRVSLGLRRLDFAPARAIGNT